MLTVRTQCFASPHARPTRARATAVRVVASENGSAFADGAKVKVVKSVKVYHAPKQPQGLDLEGMEGTILKNVVNYKGKQLSANLPYQIVFQVERDGKPAKLICHLVSLPYKTASCSRECVSMQPIYVIISSLSGTQFSTGVSMPRGLQRRFLLVQHNKSCAHHSIVRCSVRLSSSMVW